MPEKLLTPAEVARRLGVAEAEVARLTARGTLKALRLGDGLLRFHPDDVAALRLPPRRLSPKEAKPRTLLAQPAAAGVPWERVWDFLYAYDFYLFAAFFFGAMGAFVLTMPR